VALQRDFDGAEPVRPEPIGRLDGHHQHHRADAEWLLATGTLACPACDAPVLPAPGASSPADPIACGFCGEGGAVRDFLSLAEPTRPTRVVVRISIGASRV
jgi:hypothetical protein